MKSRLVHIEVPALVTGHALAALKKFSIGRKLKDSNTDEVVGRVLRVWEIANGNLIYAIRLRRQS